MILLYAHYIHKQVVSSLLMTGHLTLYLAYFSVIFNRFYKQNRGVLDQIILISGNL